MNNKAGLGCFIIFSMIPAGFSEPSPDSVGGADTAESQALKSNETDAPIAEGRHITYTKDRVPCADHRPLRKPLSGDLHVHTALSFDAVAGRINTLPKGAYD